MAEGIDVGEMLSYELVPITEAKKRQNSADGSKSNTRVQFVLIFVS